MAMGWNFTLAAGEQALITLALGNTMPGSGFYLAQTDPDSGSALCTIALLKVDIEDAYLEKFPEDRKGSGGQTGGQTDTDGDGDVSGTECTEAVSIRPKSGILQLTWSPIEGAQSYVIRRSSEAADSGYETVVDGHVTTYATYLDEGLTNGQTYWYRIAPKDDQDTEFCTTRAVSGTPQERTR